MLLELPREILDSVVPYLSLIDMVALSQLCRALRRFCFRDASLTIRSTDPWLQTNTKERLDHIRRNFNTKLVRELDIVWLPASFGEIVRLCENVKALRLCISTAAIPAFVADLRLKYLYLEGSPGLDEAPASFDSVAGITHLQLTFNELPALPTSICDLTNLTALNISRWTSLTVLPEAIGNLTALVSLDLSYCYKLGSLPSSIGMLVALQRLYLTYCAALLSLPESFGNLSALTTLEAEGCRSIKSLPVSFGTLNSLTSADLSGWSSITALPESIGALASLVSLDLTRCYRLAALPESLCDLGTLFSISLDCCKALTELPESFGDLAALRRLDLYGCKSLTKLPESIKNMKVVIHISHCDSLEPLPLSIVESDTVILI